MNEATSINDNRLKKCYNDNLRCMCDLKTLIKDLKWLKGEEFFFNDIFFHKKLKKEIEKSNLEKKSHESIISELKKLKLKKLKINGVSNLDEIPDPIVRGSLQCDDLKSWLIDNEEEHTTKKFLALHGKFRDLISIEDISSVEKYPEYQEYLKLDEKISFEIQKEINRVIKNSIYLTLHENKKIEESNWIEFFNDVLRIVKFPKYKGLHKEVDKLETYSAEIKKLSLKLKFYESDLRKKLHLANENIGISKFMQQKEETEQETLEIIEKCKDEYNSVIKVFMNVKYFRYLYYKTVAHLKDRKIIDN